MWNMIFQIFNLLVILVNFQVLSKGCQSCQSTTMLRNECTHTFLYVFGHCGEYMFGLLLILISKSWVGGVSFALLFVGAVFLLEVFSQASSQQHGAYKRKGNVKQEYLQLLQLIRVQLLQIVSIFSKHDSWDVLSLGVYMVLVLTAKTCLGRHDVAQSIADGLWN